jgi:hypothetical protein
LGQLRRLQTERCWRTAFLSEADDLPSAGIAEHREVFSGLSAEQQFKMLAAAPEQAPEQSDARPKPEITEQSQLPAAA